MDTLNDKIPSILEDKIDYANDGDGHFDIWGYDEAAKEISILLLQEKIDLLKWVRKEIGENVPFPAAPSWMIVNDKISELTNELNSIKNN